MVSTAYVTIFYVAKNALKMVFLCMEKLKFGYRPRPCVWLHGIMAILCSQGNFCWISLFLKSRSEADVQGKPITQLVSLWSLHNYVDFGMVL